MFKDLTLRVFDELNNDQVENNQEEETNKIIDFTDTSKESVRKKEVIAACDSSHKGQYVGGAIK